MKAEQFDIDNTQVQMIMVIKLQQLKREYLNSLTYQSLETYLAEELFRKHPPRSLHEAAAEIIAVNADDLVKFLARKALEDGKRQSLSDFLDVIGG
ncbi:MAG: hypothetical protein IJ225_07095 [Solobacterium sp.]|nr:hypothetical protein [Solobacterium sp.]